MATPPRDDPGLPIKFGPCSNGEYVPAPLTAVEREAIKQAREACERNAKSLGLSRRDFMFTVTAAATTLLTLQGCFLDSSDEEPGGAYTVQPMCVSRNSARSGSSGTSTI